jgi:uncharacterized protein
VTPELTSRLQAALLDARKARDTVAVAALRSLLSALANAEAIPPEEPTPLAEGPIAGARVGLGATEAARRQLSPDDVAAIVEREVTERQAAAAEYESLGRTDEAARLRAEVAVLRAVTA